MTRQRKTGRITAWLGGMAQITVIAGVAVAVVALSGRMGRAVDANAPPPAQTAGTAPTVTLITPDNVSFTPFIEANGVIEARATTTIAPQVGGRIIAVEERFKSGGLVEKGDLLFRLEDADFDLERRRALGELGAARAALADIEAEADLAAEEWRMVNPDVDIPPLAARKPQVEAARARVESAQAARDAAILAIDRARVSAPARARILTAEAAVGQIVAANEAVGTLYDLSLVELSVSISTEELAALQPIAGRSVFIPDRPSLEGVIDRVDAALDPRTRLATLRIRIQDGERATLGDFIRVKIAGDPISPAVKLPASALLVDGAVWTVSSGTARRRSVTVVGRRADAAYVAPFDIAEGVIVLPPFGLADGAPVVIEGPSQTTALMTPASETGGD